MDLFRHFPWGLACLLAAATVVPPATIASPPYAPWAAAVDDVPRSDDPRTPPYFVILDSPADYNALLQKIRRPDVEVRPVDPARATAEGAAPAVATAPWVVESVRIRGRVRGDSAALRVELAIVTAADEPTWVPIRLDGQRLVDAREGSRILDLKMVSGGPWQVGLAGRGPHRVEVELRCPLTTRPDRASLSLAIPEAPSTSLELDFDRRQTDLIVGANEVFGQSELPDGRGSRLSAHLSPRSRVEVSWAVDEESGGRNPPLLTAQGDIAIDIDSEGMRTRSSWVIRCVRGMTRTLEVRVGDQDEVTEVQLDDQQVTPGSDGGRGSGRQTIDLPEPLRPGGGERRLVMKTRRPHAHGAGRRIAFAGFPIVHAREQSGAIGVTQSPNLWVAPVPSQNLRRIVPTFLPKELAERPGTSLAFEFLDQPFSLGLDVEASPPLVRSRTRTAFRLDADRARSETSVELQWVRGRPFEVELALGPGLEVTSVGPPSVVEAWNPTGAMPAAGPSDAGAEPRGLTIRLSPTVRDQSQVTLQIEGFQKLPAEGPVKLGLFAPDETTAVSAAISVAAGRGLSVELDEEAARSAGAAGFAADGADATAGRSNSPSVAEAGGAALRVEAAGGARALPIRLARHARSIRQETLLSAEVSRRSIDLIQKSTFTVRHGTLAALVIRVPAALVGRWKLRGREAVDPEPAGRDPDGSRRYGLVLDPPVVDRATLEFQCQLPINPALEAATARDVEVPRIGFPDVADSATRVDLTSKLGIALSDGDPSWTRANAAGPAGSGESPSGMSYVEGAAGKGRAFRFRAMAMEPMAMPALLAPRLLIRCSVGFDETARYRAWYWLETHGPSFPFALPEEARIIAVRVGGRAAEQVDLEGRRDANRLYRLRLPADAASRPIAIELEYHLDGESGRSSWQAPQLLDDGLVLQTLWEMRLPWDRALLGVPRGWSDENAWSPGGGSLWIRRPSREWTAPGHWLVGEGSPTAGVEDLRESNPDESQRLLFSRSSARPGEPMEMSGWIVSRAWLVAACSGATLLVGFFVIFSRIPFRTVWAVAAVLGLLAAAMLQPAAAAQLAQSSLMGVVLTVLGLSIQHGLDRRRLRSVRTREPGSGLGPARADSSLNRAPSVGSDDPTAIRVRTPSTLDYVPAPLAGPDAAAESRSSTVGRT